MRSSSKSSAALLCLFSGVIGVAGATATAADLTGGVVGQFVDRPGGSADTMAASFIKRQIQDTGPRRRDARGRRIPTWARCVLLGALLWLALKIALVGLVVYFVIRIVSPETAERLRSKWTGPSM